MTTPARSVIVNPPPTRPQTGTAVVSRETCLRRAETLMDELHALLAWLEHNRDMRPREARNAGDVALVATHTERAQRALESFAALLGTGEETPLC